MRKGVGVLLLILGIGFFLAGVDSISGNVIGLQESNNYLDVVGLVFLLGGLALLVSGKGLEATLIPTGPGLADKERTLAAARDFYFGSNNPPDYVIISGNLRRDSGGGLSSNSQEYKIMKILETRFHIPEENILIEGNSADSLNNFLNSLKEAKAKGIDVLRIATDNLQYKRFRMFYDLAVREGIVDPGFKIEHIDSGHTRPNFLYGFNAYLKEFGKLKEAGSLSNVHLLGRGTSKDRVRWILKGIISGGLFDYFKN